jgi:hypothetical protein
MSTRSLVLARTTGALFTLLGVIHCAATPMVLAEPRLSSLDAETTRSFVVMFLGTGLGVLWSGVGFWLAARPLGRGEAWSRRMLALVALFVATLSTMCVATMPNSPFAWSALGSCCLAVWTLLSAPGACARGTATSSSSSAVSP